MSLLLWVPGPRARWRVHAELLCSRQASGSQDRMCVEPQRPRGLCILTLNPGGHHLTKQKGFVGVIKLRDPAWKTVLITRRAQCGKRWC